MYCSSEKVFSIVSSVIPTESAEVMESKVSWGLERRNKVSAPSSSTIGGPTTAGFVDPVTKRSRAGKERMRREANQENSGE